MPTGEDVFPGQIFESDIKPQKNLPRETLRIWFAESPDNHTGTDQYKSANLSVIPLFFPDFYLLVWTSVPVGFISGKQIRDLEKNPILPEKALAFSVPGTYCKGKRQDAAIIDRLTERIGRQESSGIYKLQHFSYKKLLLNSSSYFNSNAKYSNR